MIKTAEQILAEIGGTERTGKGGRPLENPPDPRLTEIMKILTLRRRELGLSQRQVVEKMGKIVVQGMISWWELGRCQPTLYNLEAYAKALGGRIEIVFDDEDQERP